ncbi:hypothetical protein MBRA1_003562 [Malassezia brasiliensis]|uniref:WD repeat-containing protein 7 n=1 Tax=Malassezia brasiliensis TaxID=1821822 RepID=A0AAF0DVK2_9BASI|nr:hypothetical protein MBRA1_003562 [Malassezia brasiliensis]
MSAAALQVPLGVPLGARAGGAPAWDELRRPTVYHDAPPDDEWGDAPEADAPPTATCTASYFAPHPASGDAGDVLVLVGFSDGVVHVYAVDVAQDDAGCMPSTPNALLTPLRTDAAPWEHAAKAHPSTAQTSAAPSASSHDARSVRSMSEASTSVSMANGHATYDAPAADAEALLGAQYHASDAPPVLAHGSSEARARAHDPPAHKAPPHPPSFREMHVAADDGASWVEPRSPRGVPDDTPLRVSSVPRLIRSLYTPDAAAVVALDVDDRVDDAWPAQVLVRQASGRVTAWSLPTLSFVGSMTLRVMQHVSRGAGAGDHDVQFVFERHATELGSQLLQPVDAFMHLARLPPSHDVALGVHAVVVLGDAPERAPPLCWAQYAAWPERVFVLCTDAVGRTLRVCAVLDAPSDGAKVRCVCLRLGAAPALQLVSAGEAVQCLSYAINDLAAFCRGMPTQAAREHTESAAPAPSGARLSLRHLALLLPARSAPHRSGAEHAAPPTDAILAPSHTHTLLAAPHDAKERVLALGVVHGVCAMVQPRAVHVVALDDALAVQHTASLPSRALHMYTLRDAHAWAIVCEHHRVYVVWDAEHGTCRTTEEAVDADAGALLVPVGGALLDLAWGGGDEAPRAHAPPFSALLPLSLSKVVVAERANGGLPGLLSTPLLSLFAGDTRPAAVPLPWDAPLTLLQQVANPRTGTRHVLGGSQAGDLGVWSAATLQLEAAYSWFAAPVQCIVPLLGVAPTSRLYGCVLCVAEDGTSALLALNDLRLVQLFPGSGAPLVQIAVRGHELLLAYGERRARIWSLATHELVRSATAEQLWLLVAKADAAGEAWLRLPVPPSPRSALGRVDKGAAGGMLSTSHAVADGAVPIVLADVRRAVDVASKSVRTALGATELASALDAPADGGEAPPKLLDTLRPLLALFLPGELDAVFAQLRDVAYDGHAPTAALVPASLGLPGFVSSAAGAQAALAATRFALDAEASAQHLVTLVALALLARFVPTLRNASTAVLDALLDPTFVREAVAPHAFVVPSLATLVRYTLDENEVLRKAAALLFRPYALATDDETVDALVAMYAPLLHDDDAAEAPHALLLLGMVASERYAYLTPGLLKHIAMGVARYLHAPTTDAAGVERVYVALELCCRGCEIWQHYVDAVALVRGIFRIAAHTDDAAPVRQLRGLSLRGLARRATLELAAHHSALFMSTLAMDILHATSVEQTQVTLRLVAFLIRQKPLALYPSLPRLVEAVVKSLDPTAGATRSAMAKSATLMISALVETYPSIAFHGATQRLAVGTQDGQVVLYDVKTATRLYVLDGHERPVTACSFSPDGRRFLSMSLDDECVLIWRLSTGLLDLLVPSSMARLAGTQTQAAADRVLHFHLGSAAHMTLADTLAQVAFEWPNARSVRLRVGEARVNLGVV